MYSDIALQVAIKFNELPAEKKNTNNAINSYNCRSNCIFLYKAYY